MLRVCSASITQWRRGCKCPVGHGGGKNGVVLWGGLPLFFTIGTWTGSGPFFFIIGARPGLGLVPDPAFFYLYGSVDQSDPASPYKKI